VKAFRHRRSNAVEAAARQGRVKEFRRRSKSAAKAEVNLASDRHGLGAQANQEPYGEQHSPQLWKARRRSSMSSVVSLRVVLASSQIQCVVAWNRRRSKVTSKLLRLSSSARRRPWERVNRANLVEAHHQKPVSRWRLRPAECIQMKRAPNEKECSNRAVKLSRRSRPSANCSSNNNEAARLRQPITARDTGSLKPDIKDNHDQRRRRGSNNFGAMTPAAPEHTPRSRFVCSGVCVKRRPMTYSSSAKPF